MGKHQNHFQIIVVGVGSMGAATCYYLASQGIQVLGLEQFDIPHERGSHTGQSRIIRKAYFEHPDYVPLLQRAYENWADLERQTSTQVYFKTGVLYIGKPAHPVMAGVRASAALYGIDVQELSPAALRKAYPVFQTPNDYQALLEPDAGFLPPEKVIRLYAEQALQQGAVLHTLEKTTRWEQTGDAITVYTERGHYTCDKLIFTAGAWAGKLLPVLASSLHVTRQLLAWITPKDRTPFQLGHFPCWTLADEDKPGIYYGFPLLPAGTFEGPVGLKVAHHVPGDLSDPDNLNRIPGQEEEARLLQALERFLPDTYAGTHAMKVCMYTNTPDENFILDFLPGTGNRVLMAAGFSGHGFKFASVIGEIMADLAIRGKTDLPIDFLSLRRFL